MGCSRCCLLGRVAAGINSLSAYSSAHNLVQPSAYSNCSPPQAGLCHSLGSMLMHLYICLPRRGKRVRKTSRRDLPAVMAAGADGATTVSATMLLAAHAGIAVFVTGGALALCAEVDLFLFSVDHGAFVSAMECYLREMPSMVPTAPSAPDMPLLESTYCQDGLDERRPGRHAPVDMTLFHQDLKPSHWDRPGRRAPRGRTQHGRERGPDRAGPHARGRGVRRREDRAGHPAHAGGAGDAGEARKGH